MKIALILNDEFSMYHFRGGLIKRLVGKGHEVYTITPPGNFKDKLHSLGAKVIHVDMHRFISPVHDLLLLRQLYRVFKKYQFHIVHNMTIKPNIYGTLSAKLAGIKRIVCLVSGIGFIYADNNTLKSSLLRWPVSLLYRVALHFSHTTWFQNPDDYQYFVSEKLIAKEKGVVIRSGGISTEEYAPGSIPIHQLIDLREEFKIPPESSVVLMVAARMIWSKGVREFVEAASALHDKFPDWYFIMVCPKDPGSPDSVPGSFFSSCKLERLIVVDEFRYDINVFEALSDIMVLPSYYREGCPRTLLEGLSMAKPIITTDHPGCRETIDEAKNGYLIPIRNSAKLIENLDRLMSDKSLRIQFGQHSRQKAENEFSEALVVHRIIREVYGFDD